MQLGRDGSGWEHVLGFFMLEEMAGLCGYRAHLRARSRVGGTLLAPSYCDVCLWAVLLGHVQVRTRPQSPSHLPPSPHSPSLLSPSPHLADPLPPSPRVQLARVLWQRTLNPPRTALIARRLCLKMAAIVEAA